MLPRLPQEVRIKKENRELVLDIAENLFPGARSISDLKKGERERWIILSCDILRENKAGLSDSIEAIAKVLDPAVQADIEDTLLKRNFFFEQEGKRSEIEEEERQERKDREKATHAENLLDQAEGRRRANADWELEKTEREKHIELEEKRFELDRDHFALERKERVTKLGNGSWRERIGLGMAVVGFLCALVLLYVGVQDGDGFVAGSSGAAAATILGVILHLLLREQKQPLPPPPTPPSGDAPAAT